MQSHESAVSRAALEEQVGGDHQLLEELTDLFCGDYPQLMEQLTAAAANRDYPKAAYAAHTLKGMVGNFGAQAAWDLAQTIECAAKSQAENLLPMSQRLDEELRRVAQGLRALGKGVPQ